MVVQLKALQMSVMMLNKNITNKGVEAGTSCQDLSPDSLEMQGGDSRWSQSSYYE